MNEPSRFDCNAAFEHLNDYLDHELSEEEAEMMREHLAKCRVCAMEYEFEASLLSNLKRKCCEGSAPPDLKVAIKALLADAKSKDSL